MSSRILYLVTEDWYFVSHRLPMARAAREAGFDVHVATRVNRHRATIETEGFQLHPLAWERGSLNPARVIGIVREIRKLYRCIEPDLVHHVSLQASFVGSIAAQGLPVVCLNAMTGLGSNFVASTSNFLIRAMIRAACRQLFNRVRSAVLVQNPDDKTTLNRLGIDDARITLIPGSGVDVGALIPTPEPTEPITAAFVGRLLENKGIRVLVDAFDILHQRGRHIRLLIAGLPDPASPTSITAREIESWRTRTNLSYLGFVKDIATLWASANLAVLPSLGGEGLPLSLLEAAACGRAMVATDVPGSREIARQNINALVVPPNDAEALADAIERLAVDPQLRRTFGTAGRQIVEKEFSNERVGRDIIALYRDMLLSQWKT